jgi:hypothetical protein
MKEKEKEKKTERGSVECLVGAGRRACHGGGGVEWSDVVPAFWM